MQATHWAIRWTKSLIHGRPTIGRWSSGRSSSCWWWWGIIVASGIVSLQAIVALLGIVIHLTERCWGGGNHTSHGTYLMLSCILSITYSHPCGCSRIHNLYILSPKGELEVERVNRSRNPLSHNTFGGTVCLQWKPQFGFSGFFMKPNIQRIFFIFFLRHRWAFELWRRGKIR